MFPARGKARANGSLDLGTCQYNPSEGAQHPYVQGASEKTEARSPPALQSRGRRRTARLPPVRLRPHSPSQAVSAALSPNKGKNKQKSSTPASGLRSPMGVSLHSLSQHRDTSGSFLFYFNVDILHTWLQPPWRLFLRVFNIPSGLCTIIYFALLLLLDGWPVFKSLTPLRSGLAS